MGSNPAIPTNIYKGNGPTPRRAFSLWAHCGHRHKRASAVLADTNQPRRHGSPFGFAVAVAEAARGGNPRVGEYRSQIGRQANRMAPEFRGGKGAIADDLATAYDTSPVVVRATRTVPPRVRRSAPPSLPGDRRREPAQARRLPKDSAPWLLSVVAFRSYVRNVNWDGLAPHQTRGTNPRPARRYRVDLRYFLAECVHSCSAPPGTPWGLCLSDPAGSPRLSAPHSDPGTPCEILPACPICGIDQLQKAADRLDIIICLCASCGTSMTVPRDALRLLKARLANGNT